MDYKPVTSSNIAEIGFDSADLALGVKFKNGGEYIFLGVSEEVYNQFLNAESAGKFFASNIKGKYSGSKVENPPENAY